MNANLNSGKSENDRRIDIKREYPNAYFMYVKYNI